MPGAPRALFHRTESGATGTDAPSVRFVGGRRWVGILANPGFEQLLFDVMGMAAQAVGQATGRVSSTQIERHTMAVAQRFDLSEYWIREMAIKRRTKARRDAPLEAIVKEVILRDIECQANRFGLDLPPRDQIDLFVDISRHLGLRLQTTAGITNEYVTLVDASFHVNLHLAGNWFAGNLTSRGYGRIGRRIEDLAMPRRENGFQRSFVQ